MVDDLIERNRLLKEIREVYEYEYPTASGAFDDFVTKILPNIIRNQPTVDSAPVTHAHWVRQDHATQIEEYFFPSFSCSHCETVSIERMNFCGECGATMDEPKEGYSDGR